MSLVEAGAMYTGDYRTMRVYRSWRHYGDRCACGEIGERRTLSSLYASNGELDSAASLAPITCDSCARPALERAVARGNVVVNAWGNGATYWASAKLAPVSAEAIG